jgi:hypothetical protein
MWQSYQPFGNSVLAKLPARERAKLEGKAPEQIDAQLYIGTL